MQARTQSLGAYLLAHPHHRRKWGAQDLVDYFEAFLQTKSAAGLKKIVHALNRLASRKSCTSELIVANSPSATLLREMVFSIDVALILLARERNSTSTGSLRYYTVDSSPQGNNNWLLSKCTVLDSLTCCEAAASANDLIPLVYDVAQTLSNNHPSDSKALNSNQKVLAKRVQFVTSQLVEHSCVPTAIGLSHANTAHKAAAFLHSIMLEFRHEDFKESLLNVVSFTTDLGVEVGIPGFRSNLEDLLPTWRQQSLTKLEEVDSIMAAPETEATKKTIDNFSEPVFMDDGEAFSQTLDEEMPTHCQQSLRNLEDVDSVMAAPDTELQRNVALDVDADVLVVKPRPSSGIDFSKETASPFLKEAWEKNPSWHSIVLPFAIPVPGMLHITNNLLADVDSGMTHWPVFWEQLDNVSSLLSHIARLDKFRAKCIDPTHDDAQEAVLTFSCKIDVLYSKRWGSISHFLSRCQKRLSLLKIFWDASLYCGNNDQEDGFQSRFNPKLLTETLRDPKFWAYCDMVRIVHAAVDELAGWSEGCVCHPPWVWQKESKARRQKLLAAPQGCPMQGRRAPELACGAWRTFIDKLFAKSVWQLTVAHQRQLPAADWLELVADFEHAKACAQTVLRIKLNCWSKLPWLLCGLAHHDTLLAAAAAKKSLQSYDSTKQELQHLHHPLSIAMLSSDFQCRCLVDCLAKGVPLSNLPSSFQVLVNSFKFIPIAEREIEAKHKDVKRALGRLTRHSAPRVSLAIREKLFLEWTRDDTKIALMGQAVEAARQVQQLPAMLGLAGHPDLLRCCSVRETRKALTKVMYRCDLPSQYYDLTKASRLDEAIKAKEKQVAQDSTQLHRKAALTWDAVVAKALTCYLQAGCSRCVGVENGRRPCFSTDLRLFQSIRFTPLTEVLENSHLNPEACMNKLPRVGTQVFFSPLASKQYSRLHRAPHAAAVGASLLRQDCILCLVHQVVESSSGEYILAINQFHSNSGDDESREEVNPVWVLSNVSSAHLDSGGLDLFLEWDSAPGSVFYTIKGWAVDNSSELRCLSNILDSMLQNGAVLPFDSEGVADVAKMLADMPTDEFITFATDCSEEVRLLEELKKIGLAAAGDSYEVGFDYVLLPKCMQQLQWGPCLCNPTPILSSKDLESRRASATSSLHGLLQLAADGWIWQPMHAKKVRNNEPYKADGLKVFFSSSVDVDVSYIRCLLLAEHLFQKGYACLPHGLSNKQYSQVLNGSLSPKALLQLASAPARTSKQASSKSAAALQDDADVYAGYACNVEKAIHDKVTSLVPRVASKSGGSAPVHSKHSKPSACPPPTRATSDVPRYFERQVGAHCGLHALNNVCGARAGLQSFSLDDIADGVRTLQEEHARDGLPWNARDHVSLSGDYSLALLQWVLQRRLVKKVAAPQFTATNLMSLVMPEQLVAVDLLGGLVHVPSAGDPTHGHWVAFAKHQDAPATFWWMDSLTGFEKCSLDTLRERLATHRFVLTLVSRF